MKIFGVVPVFKPSRNDFENIVKYCNAFEQVVVVDDTAMKCDDGILEIIKKKNITYLLNDKEVGFSVSVNNGTRYAIDNGAEWVLLINQDSVIDTRIVNIYKEYLRTHDTQKVAALCPQYDYDRHKRSANKGYKKLQYADMAGTLIKSDIWDEIGGYDKRFFIDGSDF